MQTVRIPSHDKSIQTTCPRSHNKNTQINVQSKDILIRSDPGITNLQGNLAQAWLTIEILEEETVPQQRYHEF